MGKIISQFPNILKDINSSDAFCINLVKERNILDDPNIISNMTTYDLEFLCDHVGVHPFNGFLRIKVLVSRKFSTGDPKRQSTLFMLEKYDVDLDDIDNSEKMIEKIIVRVIKKELVNDLIKHENTYEPLILIVKYDQMTINRVLSNKKKYSQMTSSFMPEVVAIETN